MGNNTSSSLYAVLSLASVVCGLIGFYLGRKKEATDTGKSEGVLQSNVQNMLDKIEELKNSFNTMSKKIESNEEKREKEYRELLINQTRLETRFDLFEKTFQNKSRGD